MATTKKQTFYITTPIYYASGKLHIGHSYTTIVCDAIARFKRMQGFDVFYLTGTDEHGEKVEENAKKAGLSPKAFVDGLVEDYKKLWEILNIKYDKFIRTTDEYHEKSIQKIFTLMYEKGDIYKGFYEGLYCTPCEAFWTETQVKDGKCPDCGREVKTAKEESYFFRLSKYADRLLAYYKENPEFLQPKMRENEMTAFIKSGLRDLAVSRTSVKWGIPVPFDEKHTIYVWIDALFNYMTALGYFNDSCDHKKFWPADIHVVAKEITRFHMIYWPAFLMALDLPLPKQVYGHGWLLFGNDKMSKSKGNIADPVLLAERYGVDAVRYYLLRELSGGNDGNYTTEAFLGRINSDLCNDLGNLLSRTTAMIEQYFGGTLPKPVKEAEEEKDLVELCKNAYAEVSAAMPLNCPQALAAIWKLIRAANKYIDITAPWTLNKNGDKDRLATVMYNLAQSLYTSAVLLLPFLPETAETVLKSLGIEKIPADFKTVDGKYGSLKAGAKTQKIPALYPRLDIEKEVAKIAAETAAATEPKKEENKKMEEVKNDIITIDDFAKIKLRTAKVIACEKVEKADKLLNLTLQLGEETRTVLSGIAEHYKPEEMVGKTVVVVANLAPRKMRGIDSHGMILCADADGKVVIVSPEKEVPSGGEVR